MPGVFMQWRYAVYNNWQVLLSSILPASEKQPGNKRYNKYYDKNAKAHAGFENITYQFATAEKYQR